MSDILCLKIQNKTGMIVTVPLKTWENGLKLDPDWHIYAAPKPNVIVERPVVVEFKKPVPTPVPPAVAVQARVIARANVAKHKRK